ncbi:hypothetical protein IOD16_22575 [Saccharothrix sp. 6-C]|uniref:hypothetical protein n=1 Tax=Saccharothrix sp. 6-C TaxID=2781735 RepID=UPI001916D16D|nr:hypothetical protein [Saccharothrix sp. 6-C]QQQ74010.1 hypothetical protein IOD16_22575 [Saccharothrix sp. 6-C]
MEKSLPMIASGAVVASVPALPGGVAASAPVPPRSTSAAGQCHHADDFAPREGLGADVCETGDGLFEVRTASGDHVTHGLDVPTSEHEGVRDEITPSAITTPAARAPHCATDSYRVQLIYLIPAGRPTRRRRWSR